jgi:hypothetical protein
VSAEAAALAGRTAAERTMLDTGTAKRPTGGSTYNPATQASVTAYADLFTDTPCKLQARGLVSTINEVGDRSATTIRVELHLPASTDPLTTGDVWEITAASNLSMATVGDRFRVVAPFAKSVATARRYEVERVVS